MKLHFDPNQDFQLNAIQSVVDLFEGQPLNKGDFEFSLTDDHNSLQLNENGFGNKLMIVEQQIFKNLQIVQQKNGIDKSDQLSGLNFSLEMETGTGKTYVYLRTIYELNENYGFKKFVIVVPSIAIKEGVLKNLEITHNHFQSIYSNTPINYIIYDSKKVPLLRGFAASNNIQILVINIDSFAKDINIINQDRDSVSGKKPIEFIQSTNPIVIVDEPQNMETDIRKAAIANLNPLCTLRYSATHKYPYNLIYRLDPVKAYDLGLVKQIEVDSIYTDDTFNEAYIKLIDFRRTRSKVSAKVEIDVNDQRGVKKKVINLDNGNDLYLKSNNREIYKDGYILNNLDAENGFIEFANGLQLSLGETKGGFTEDILKTQIQKTIEEHFNKEKRLRDKGIKVLSLFFIDHVANYRRYDENGNPFKGKFAEWFEEIYDEYSKKPLYKGVIPFEKDKVHNGYFAMDKKGVFKDTSGRESKDEEDAYNLIMKDKEKLLDINNPLRFIFSHSALKEGWDSPNVFQLCTLRDMSTEREKRQTIGRGLRLSVNQEGIRIKDKNINLLTVVANQTFSDFAHQLQTEIETETGVEFKNRIRDKRKRVPVTLKKKYELDEKFLALWDKIKQKTIYRVQYSTDDLINDSAIAIKEMEEIRAPVILYERHRVRMDYEEGVASDATTATGAVIASSKHFDIPDVISYVQSKTELTRSTITKILFGSERLQDLLINPQSFLDKVVSKIQNVLHKLMIDGIKYEKIAGQYYEMQLFESNEIEAFINNLHKVKDQNKTLYNYIEFQSDTEERFAKDCEDNDNIEFYIKLPYWFQIKTPIGSYNPDWALIYKNDKRIYFVAETKGSLDDQDLRKKEDMKIKCGEKHFKEFEDVNFQKVTKVSDLTT